MPRQRSTQPFGSPRWVALLGALSVPLPAALGQGAAGPAAAERVSVIFQAEPCGSVREAGACAADRIDVAVSPGSSPVVIDVWAALSSRIDPCADRCGDVLCLECNGIQSWSLSLGLEGDGTRIVEATTERTESGIDCGFEHTEVVDPLLEGEDGAPQGEGVVSFRMLLCGDAVTLNPTGTVTVLSLKIALSRAAAGATSTASIRCRDGLRGTGIPVANTVGISGAAGAVGACGAVELRATSRDEVAFVRCEVNFDGVVDLSDAVRLLAWLFLGRTAPNCAGAADCNRDRRSDLSDAVYLLSYHFLGGPPPAAPFPECGLDPLLESSCEPGSTACPP